MPHVIYNLTEIVGKVNDLIATGAFWNIPRKTREQFNCPQNHLNS